MGQKKTILISLLVQLLLAAVVVVGLYSAWNAKLDPTRIEYSMYAKAPQAWPVRCWHDALFTGALLWLGFGGMMFVAATDFFDIFGYAFSSLLVLFSPLKSPKEHKKFYEYKQDKAEKRRKREEERRSGNAVPLTMVIVGALLLIAAVALLFVHDGMLPEDAFHLTDAYDVTQTAPDGGEDDLVPPEGSDMEQDAAQDEEPAGDGQAPVIPEDTDETTDTTGGENHE